jgi:hypothetical protein
MNVEFAKQTNVTQQWMQTGQCQIIVPAWYKRYCTVGARKLPHNAARTVRAYDTVVTHPQQEKAITKFILVKSQGTRQQATRTTGHQCSNSQGMRGRQGPSEKLRGKGRKTRKFEEGSGQTNKCDTTMDARTWATSNRHTSMVQAILYNQRVNGNYRTMQPVQAYDTVEMH